MKLARRSRRVKKQPAPSPVVGELIGLLVIAVAGLCLISLYTDRAGVIGTLLARALNLGLGSSAPWWLLVILGMGIAGLFAGRAIFDRLRLCGIIALSLLLSAWYHSGFPTGEAVAAGRAGFGGGLIGGWISFVLGSGFGDGGRRFILITATVAAILLIIQIPLRVMFVWMWSVVATARRSITMSRGQTRKPSIPVTPAEPIIDTGSATSDLELDVMPEPAAQTNEPVADASVSAADDPPPTVQYEQMTLPDSAYDLPSINLLDRPTVRTVRNQRSVQERARLLEDTLTSFGVNARVIGASQGPAVTRFELQPGTGVKVSRIVSLANDIALSLAAPDVRIEAPIPGKAAIGVEVPNEQVALVTLREVLTTSEFARHASRLTMPLGRDVSGRPIVAGLEQLLHLLIAGSTGSGKSVCLNALITGLLFRAPPSQMRMLLIDPKVVELSTYNGIPHLLAPVVTDARQAAGSLKWAVVEMERRYALFAQSGVKDIGKYNDIASSGQERERLPFLVIVIDELADLMSVAPNEVEDSIQRLAQMARAAGIHLIVATQRPSVDVITGVIKANIPSRIAFSVASAVDSRTILDASGADKLVGKGDMLFLPAGTSKPIRVQGAFVSDREVEAVTDFWRSQGEPAYADVAAKTADNGDGERDELLPQATQLVIEYGHASASLLQRRLRVGYARAARIIDQMEERGFISERDGSRPREVLIDQQTYERAFGPTMDDPQP